MASLVMGPEGSVTGWGDFSDKVPPSFDGHGDYTAYREDVTLWIHLTSLSSKKQGPALVGRLSGEAKASVKTLSIEIICSPEGVLKILEHLDKSYAVDETDKLDTDLAKFLDFTWKKEMTIEEFIAGFHTRLDKIASLNIDDKLKGHLLLRQAGLDNQDRNMIVGAASGKYEVKNIGSALRCAFRNREMYSSSMKTSGTPLHNKEGIPYQTKANPRKKNSRNTKNLGQPNTRQTFYTYRTISTHESKHRAIVDSGACTSVVGKLTLDKFMKNYSLDKLPDSSPSLARHRFGNHSEDHRTLFAVKVPFTCSDKGKKTEVVFNVKFDVIEGDLPFLLGFPSLSLMKSNLNFNNFTLGLPIRHFYHRLSLEHDGNHIYLPLNPKIEKRSQLFGKTSSSCYTRSYYEPSRYEGSNPNVESAKNAFMNDNKNEGDQMNAKKIFKVKDLKKLHLQLRHGTKTQMTDYIKAAACWDDSLNQPLEDLLSSCKCHLAFPPKNHPIASINPPKTEKQSHVLVDILNLEGFNFLHVVDRATGWSELGLLRRKLLKEQIRVFRAIQLHRHGPPLTITGDQEYNKVEIKSFCNEIGAQLVPTSANDHEANGSVESANRIVRSYFNRLRSVDKKTSAIDLASEATYGKNICKGNKIASSYELMYGKAPRILDGYDNHERMPATIEEHAQETANRRLKRMLQANIRDMPNIKVGDIVHFWRDNAKWIGPAKVVEIDKTSVTVEHNNQLKTSSLNRVRKWMPMPYSLDEDDNEETNSNDGSSAPAGNTNRPAGTQGNKCRRSSRLAQLQNRDNQIDQQSNTQRHDSTQESPNIDDQVEVLWPEDKKYYAGTVTSINNKNYNIKYDDGEVENDLDMKQEVWRYRNSTTRNRANSEKVISEGSDSNEEDNISRYSTFMTDVITQRQITQEEKVDSYRREIRGWIDKKAFTSIHRSDIPKNSNIIASHVVYRRKSTGVVKARICPWGHRDVEKDYLRSDAPCMNFETFRLVLSIAAEKHWQIGQMDVKAAYLQAQGFNRDIYVKPPKEENDSDRYWKLTAAAYGLTESGRLWYLTSDSALTEVYGLSKSKYENTLYFKKSSEGNLVFLLVTQVDNYIYCGLEQEITEFESFLRAEFDVGELDRKEFTVMGCEIVQDETKTIALTQQLKNEELDLSDLKKLSSSRKGFEIAGPKEITAYRSIIGKMLFIGRMSQPPMLFHASHMATKLKKLLSHHLKDLAALVKNDKKQIPKLLFISTPIGSKYALEAYSDAAMCNKQSSEGRNGFIVFRRCGDIVHPIY